MMSPILVPLVVISSCGKVTYFLKLLRELTLDQYLLCTALLRKTKYSQLVKKEGMTSTYLVTYQFSLPPSLPLFFHFLFHFHLFSYSYDAHIKAWDIGMKEAQEYKLTHYPKATIRSVCQGENVSPQTNIYIHTHII